MSPPRAAPFHLTVKPVGPSCNLACGYCFYLDRDALFPPAEGVRRMSRATLETLVRQAIAGQEGEEVGFAWQGGEPTLAGLPFFEEAVALQRRYRRPGVRVVNTLQTNGTLLTDAWCAFLRRHDFLVGLSLDGPEDVHDRARVDRGGRPTFRRVKRGLDLLHRHGVAFNVLAAVGAHAAGRGTEVYRFLRGAGARFIQFVPVVERVAPDGGRVLPPSPGAAPVPAAVSPASISAAAWGRFLTDVFDPWVRRDVGTVYVQLFDAALGAWLGLDPPLCTHARRCGRAVALEHDGSLYACDHYVTPSHRLGNLHERPLHALVDLPSQARFGRAKEEALPRDCRDCRFLAACRGDCPKHRFVPVSGGGPGISHLCAGYRAFFQHAEPAMRTMADLARAGRAPREVMATRS